MLDGIGWHRLAVGPLKLLLELGRERGGKHKQILSREEVLPEANSEREEPSGRGGCSSTEAGMHSLADTHLKAEICRGGQVPPGRCGGSPKLLGGRSNMQRSRRTCQSLSQV